MANGLMHYLREAWKQPDTLVLRGRMLEWRRGSAIEKVERPLRLDKAKALGYSAKPGITVLRVRLMRGGRRRPVLNVKRRSKRNTNRKTLMLNYRGVAELRAAAKYPNMEVLNSYWVGKDGENFYYEVIMVDPHHPQIMADRKLRWMSSGKNKGRAFRGLTSAGTKSRGLRATGRNKQFSPPVTAYKLRKQNR